MFRNSRSTSGMRMLLRLVSIGILILVFSFDSAGQATPVQAAPPAQDAANVSTRHYFSIVLPRQPICAGKTREVVVTPLEDAVINDNGQTFHFDHMHVQNIEIVGEVENESFGTLSPRIVQSGMAWAMAHALDETDQAQRANPGEAVFTFHAKKAGQTELRFIALIRGEFVGSAIPVKIVNCKYKVKMRYRRSEGGFTIVGALATTIQGDGEQMTGSGILDAKSTVAAPCGVSITDFLGPTDITGTSSPDGEQLNLNFEYGSATTTTSAGGECAITFSTTENPTAFLIASAALPSDGGTRTFAAPQGGTMTITAEPEEEGVGS